MAEAPHEHDGVWGSPLRTCPRPPGAWPR